MANILASATLERDKDKYKDNTRDALTGFRIGNLLIGKEMIQFQMEGRKYISLEKLQSPDITRFHFDEEDWVTAGVVHRRIDSKSQSGKSVSYLQLTDLKDVYVNLFLHGDLSQYSSIPVGGVIYLINANVILSNDGNHRVALSVSSSQYIKHIGNAVDYGICRGIQRNGKKCGNAVNKEVSQYCMYHVRLSQAMINTMRSELSDESIAINKPPQNLSEGRFKMGKEVIDCRSQKKPQFDASLLPQVRSTVVNGISMSPSAARRIQQQEEEKKRKESVLDKLKFRTSQEIINHFSVPELGRGSNGKTVSLEDEREKQRIAKIAQVKERLEAIQNQPPSRKRGVSELSSGTGNSVFDSLVKSAKSALAEKKSEVLEKKSAYADKEQRDKLRLLKEREQLLQRKEEARLKMMSLEVTCYYCYNCKKYVERGLAKDFCDSRGHFLERKIETKRMFECMQCHQRRSFIGTTKPVTPCFCGSHLWKLCPFFKEKEVEEDHLKITIDNPHILYSHTIVAKDDSYFLFCYTSHVYHRRCKCNKKI